MPHKYWTLFIALAVAQQTTAQQFSPGFVDPRPVLQAAAKVIGADNLRCVTLSGTGYAGMVGQQRLNDKNVDWPRGEPLANYRNVLAAMQLMLDDLGYDLSRRRVTLSTSGLVPQIYRLAEDCNVALAVSLHAPNDRLRDELVPINRKHPIAELLDACWHYLERQNGRSVTFEYTMLDRVNDMPAQARELAALLRGHDAKVNLIPFNTFPGTKYRRSPAATIQKFRHLLVRGGLMATVRRTRGDDIDAACGQLRGQVLDRTQVRLGSKLVRLAVQA